jgi:hypothetical protein
VLILWAWSAILSGVVLVPTYSNAGNAVVPFLVAALAVVLFTLFHPGVRQPRADLGADAAVWPKPTPIAPPDRTPSAGPRGARKGPRPKPRPVRPVPPVRPVRPLRPPSAEEDEDRDAQ